MPSIDRGGDTPVLSSIWTGLSPHLIASFFPVQRFNSDDGKSSVYRRAANSPEVQAPITEGSIENVMNWHSPFENTGVDAKFSAISALLQSGALAPLMASFNRFLEEKGAGNGLTSGAEAMLKSLEGKTSVTKLNSTQVFAGMPPTKITVTAHFRALFDAKAEVRDPINQLIAWALPQKLAQNGPVLSGTADLYPSDVPQILGMKYADMLILPVVIESIPYPLTAPRDSGGTLLSAQMTISLATLQGIDKNDWKGYFG